VQRLREACRLRQIAIVHLVNRRSSHSAQWKDCEFSRATVNELWEAGRNDAHYAAANREWITPRDPWDGMRIHELARSGLHQTEHAA
jgi:NTE family protein